MSKECPLKKGPYDKCSKEKCAWYLVKSKQCAVPLIASEIQKRRKQEQIWMTPDKMDDEDK